nr:reverse transcriptase domain-containing protein [Tanacetum cinerariifolium]
MSPPPGLSTLTSIPGPNANELPPITTFAFTTTTPENTPLTHRASTSTNPDLIISPAFVEANYEILKSFLRERRKQIRNKDLRTELKYFSEEYDEEREMEPRPV